jgi:molybdate transport system substrate-binding protein
MKFLFLASMILNVTVSSKGVELMVFAAASLTNALQEAGAVYEQHSKGSIRYNFAASNLLARQIEEGAPADVFFSADEAKMDGLEKKGLIISESRRSLLSNTLVIITPADSDLQINTPDDLASPRIRNLALAQPQTVPAGIYAKKYLEQRGLWKTIESKIIPTQNVRAALAAVESGNADVAIVYKTDVTLSRNARIAYEIPRSDTPGISYSIAIVKRTQQPEAAAKFVNFLASDDCKKIFQRLGFVVLQQPS